jgi:hypothetical protein
MGGRPVTLVTNYAASSRIDTSATVRGIQHQHLAYQLRYPCAPAGKLSHSTIPCIELRRGTSALSRIIGASGCLNEFELLAKIGDQSPVLCNSQVVAQYASDGRFRVGLGDGLDMPIANTSTIQAALQVLLVRLPKKQNTGAGRP